MAWFADFTPARQVLAGEFFAYVGQREWRSFAFAQHVVEATHSEVVRLSCADFERVAPTPRSSAVHGVRRQLPSFFSRELHAVWLANKSLHRNAGWTLRFIRFEFWFHKVFSPAWLSFLR